MENFSAAKEFMMLLENQRVTGCKCDQMGFIVLVPAGMQTFALHALNNE